MPRPYCEAYMQLFATDDLRQLFLQAELLLQSSFDRQLSRALHRLFTEVFLQAALFGCLTFFVMQEAHARGAQQSVALMARMRYQQAAMRQCTMVETLTCGALFGPWWQQRHWRSP
jgi:hypothetical protein